MSKNGKKESIEPQNCLEDFFVTFPSKIVEAGNREPYKLSMLFEVPKSTIYTKDVLQKGYELRESILETGELTMQNIVGLNFKETVMTVTFFFLSDLSQIFYPIFLKRLIRFLLDEDSKQSDGYFFLGGILAVMFVKTALNVRANLSRYQIFFSLFNVLRAFLARVVVDLTPTARRYITFGTVSVMVNADISKIALTASKIYIVLVSPILFLVYCIMIVIELGLVGFLAPVVIVLALFFQNNITKTVTKLDTKRRILKDKRVNLINEMILGIKTIKFNAWENAIHDKGTRIRVSEQRKMFLLFFVKAMATGIINLVPSLCAALCFSLHQMRTGEPLSVEQSYALIVLFNLLLRPLDSLLLFFLSYSAAKVSNKRLGCFFGLDQMAKETTYAKIRNEVENAGDNGFVCVKGDFSWEDPESEKKMEVLKKKRGRRGGGRPGKRPQKSKKTSAATGSGPMETKSTFRSLESSSRGGKDQIAKSSMQDLSLTVEPTEFVTVIGGVGSGKSSLLHTIAKDLKKVKGDGVYTQGKIAFITQEAFLLNDTLKNNIIFGKKYEKDLYETVIEMCQLTPDLEVLPAGDETEIGERGINLSGGQKQRICIARAVYSDSDIYLIDDCLSALDPFVAKKILERVFFEVLEDKTRIMATNELGFLDRVDRVVLMKSCKILQEGRFTAVKESQEFKEYSEVEKTKKKRDITHSKGEDEGASQEKETKLTNSKHDKDEEDSKKDKTPIKNLEKRKQGSSKTMTAEKTPVSLSLKNTSITKKSFSRFKSKENNSKEKGKLTKAEKTFTGQVGYKTYLFYAKFGGSCVIVTTLTIFGISTFLNILSSWWIGQWAGNSYESFTSGQYITVYLLLITLFFISFLTKLGMFAYFSTSASLRLFKDLVWNVLRRKMTFFDTTPSGVIINRCTDDLEATDYRLPALFSRVLNYIFTISGTLLLAILVSPLVLIVVGIDLFLFNISFRKYIRTTTELRRLKKVSQSPKLTRLSELISGATVIRGYNYHEKLFDKWTGLHNITQKIFVHEKFAEVWIFVRLELSIIVVVALAGFLIVFGKGTRINVTQDGTTLSLLMTYLIRISLSLRLFLFALGEVAKGMSSVQRLEEYISDESAFEPEFFKPKPKSADWPKQGGIQIKDLSTRYRNDLPLVLKNLDFEVKPQEKVAIVGRTGSGKSTLILTLMRILEASKNEESSTKGAIYIDDTNIGLLGLNYLRRAVTIIPQDPYIFEGSLRFNVDPMNEYGEDQVLKVLDIVKFWETIKAPIKTDARSTSINSSHQGPKLKSDKGENSDKSGSFFSKKATMLLKEDNLFELTTRALDKDLNLPIKLKGQNLSVGQKQLICIARALIREPKILLMDEATASVDKRTDSVIQQVVKSSMGGSTVLTIAHRLETIIQYDKVIVLGDGRKLEEGSPSELIRNGGHFSDMVGEGGNDFKKKMLFLAENKDVDPVSLSAGSQEVESSGGKE